jgi:hypothetical protein
VNQSPEQAIRQVGTELRARAQASGSFLKPVGFKFGAWQVRLAFGTTAEMGKLVNLESQQRERLGVRSFDPGYRPAPSWSFSAMLDVPLEALAKIEPAVTGAAHDQLGALAAAVGVPKSKLLHPVEVTEGGVTIVNWQWRDELR